MSKKTARTRKPGFGNNAVRKSRKSPSNPPELDTKSLQLVPGPLGQRVSQIKSDVIVRLCVDVGTIGQSDTISRFLPLLINSYLVDRVLYNRDPASRYRLPPHNELISELERFRSAAAKMKNTSGFATRMLQTSASMLSNSLDVSPDIAMKMIAAVTSGAMRDVADATIERFKNGSNDPAYPAAADHALALFSAALVRLWIGPMDQELTIWAADGTDNASPLVIFVHRCFELAGVTKTKIAVKQLLKRLHDKGAFEAAADE